MENTPADQEFKHRSNLSTGDSTAFKERMQSAKALMDKETRNQHQSLTQSKGRAQITATTAMSIVNVALLKSVIDRGHQDNRFYIVSLALISGSLCLQIIAGILSIRIEQMMSHMTEHGKNLLEEKANCCPWRCVKKRGATASKNDDNKPARSSEDRPRQMEKWPNYPDSFPSVDSESGLCACLPWKCTQEVYSGHESHTLQKYSWWQERCVENELRTIGAKEELDYQLQVVEDVKKSLEALKKKKTTKTGVDKKVIDKEIQLKEKRMEEALESKRTCKENVMKANKMKDQGDILKAYANSVRKSRVMQLTAFWQRILNYIFYTIFIMNAFITGFGISDSPNPVVNGAPGGVTSVTDQ